MFLFGCGFAALWFIDFSSFGAFGNYLIRDHPR